MSFIWHTLKSAANLQRHGVAFEEAQSVFRDPLAVTVDDEIHSEQEPREIIIGHSDRGRLLFVCFTERGEDIRLISAREPTRQERKKYEDNARF
jgi:uncharacterized protein